MCSEKSLFKPSVQVRIAPLREIINKNKVTISCVVEGPDNTVVSWMTNDVNTQPTKEVRDQSNNIVSNLTLNQNQWIKWSTIVCSAKHPCFPKEDATIQTDDLKKGPVVLIRRPFVESVQAGSAVLECVVKDLPSGDVCIKFQANSADISDISCVNWAPSENNWPLTKRFTVPNEHQRKEKTFTCTVYRAFKNWKSNTTGNIFAIRKPSITLLRRTEGNEIKLQCQLNDYYPEEILVQWFRGDRLLSGANDKILQKTEKGEKTFSFISELSISSQYENILYICKATHNSEDLKQDYNMCREKSLFKPSVQVRIAPLRDIINEDKVTISCVIEGPDNTVVSWLTNDVNTQPTKEVRDQSNNIVSNLTLNQNEWIKWSTIVCSAKHPCFPKEDATIQTDDLKKGPVVLIRRPFMESVQADSAVLECVVKDLPSGDVCIKFQANSADISDISCVNWAPSENNWPLTKRFTVPNEHQRKEKTFTCTVYRAFKNWKSNTTGNIFGDPSVELVVVSSLTRSSSESQKLLCSATGLVPKIKWLSESVEKKSSISDITMMEDGRVKVHSEILVPQQQWKQGTPYICQIMDGNKTVSVSTSICTVIAPSNQRAEVYLQGPSPNYVGSDKTVYLTCWVFGQNVKHFSIQWTEQNRIIDNQDNILKKEPIEHANGTQSIQSMLKVLVENWKAHLLYTCEVKHLCSNDTQKQSISKTRDPKQPTVRLLRPSDSDLSGLQNTSLLCFITGFFPSDIFVQWQLNGSKLDESHFTNSPVVAHTLGGFSMHSTLILPASQWMDGMYSCVVYHESSEKPVSASLENLYASLVQSAPSSELVQGARELVCLVFGFSPPAINITWLLGTTELFDYSESKPTKGTNGKFSIQSRLPLLPSDWSPGEVYRCRVTHVTGTQLINISKSSAIFEEAVFINENKPEHILQETVEETWNMACAFLMLFLLSLLYGFIVTLVKVNPK